MTAKTQPDRRRPEAPPELKVIYRLYGWAVEFGRGYRSMILEEPDALAYAVKHHGIVKPLFERLEMPNDPLREASPSPAHA